MKVKSSYLILFSLGLLSFLTAALRGSLPERTYLQLEIPASDVRVAIVTHGSQGSIGWIIQDFSQDFNRWHREDRNIVSSFFVEDKILYLKSLFNESREPQFVRIYRRLNLELSEYPIFRINISVSKGASYHIRFKGLNHLEEECEVWWESSPLDDIPGTGEWEVHSVDLRGFSEQATGEFVSKITLIEIILDKSFLRNSVGEKFLKISSIEFSQENLRIKNILGNSTFISSDDPFDAIIIYIPQKYQLDTLWKTRWVSVTYILTSSSKFEYETHLLSRDGKLSQKAQGSIFLSHQENFIDINRLDASPGGAIPRSEGVTFLLPLISSPSIAIVKRGFDPTGFLSFELHSIEIMLSKENPSQISLGQTIPTIVLMITAIIAIPIALMAYAFYLKQGPEINLKKFIPFIYGVGVRLALSPFTGHPYDMEVWTQATRIFYESGIIDIRTFPLPLTYYLLLLTYSPYALLRILGLSDTFFFFHRFRMIEALFLKAPFILSDILSLFLLLRIFKELKIWENTAEKFVPALMYFLNPLTITLSSIWGMYDGISVSLFLAGIYYSILKGRTLLGALFYILSGLTKAFGFLGLVPLAIKLIKEKRILKLLSIFMIFLTLSILLYLPLLNKTGFLSIPELFIQFLRGRAGLGSNPPYIASSSYMSFLYLSGLKINPPYLTYLLIALFALISTLLFLDIKTEKNLLEIILKYFIIFLFIFYLTFFRVYEQYYLWVIPILIIYSYIKEIPSMRYTALCISIFAFPTLLLGVLLTGTDYYWLHINLPSDTAIIAILPSSQVALGLINILNLKKTKRIFKTTKNWIALTSITSWFSASLAYHLHYGEPFLGCAWYFISPPIVLASAYIFYKEMGHHHKEKAAMPPDIELEPSSQKIK